jgi:hypothetical protein
MMKKYLALALATPLIFTACSPSSEKGSDGGSKTPSNLQINATNSEVIIRASLSEFATTDEFLSNPAESFTGLIITGDDSSTKMADPRAIVARIQETIACDTGSASVTANTADVDTAPLPASGNSSFEANYNNCTFISNAEGFNFSMAINGRISASFVWTGYTAPDTFDTFDISYDVDKFSLAIDVNGNKNSFEIDFNTSLSFDDPNASYSFAGSFEIDEAGGGFVDVQTVNPILMDINNTRPSSGKVVMNGAGNSSISYTVVANGIEVSVNGGQAKLHTWADIDALEE